MTCYRIGGCGPYEMYSCSECPASKPEYANKNEPATEVTSENNMICNRCENLELLTPYINKPVYIKGYCWNRTFDGWVVIYERESEYGASNLVFDHRGKTYPVYGFLPSNLTLSFSSTYNNAFYKEEV